MNRALVAATLVLLTTLALVDTRTQAQAVPTPVMVAGVYVVRLEIAEAGPRCGDRMQVGDITSGLWAIDTTSGGRSFAIRWIGDPLGFFGGRSAPAVVAGPAIQVVWSPSTTDQDSALLGVAADGSLTGQLRTVRTGCTIVRNVSAQRLH